MYWATEVGVSVLGLDTFSMTSWVFRIALILGISALLGAYFLRTWYFSRRRIVSHIITAEYESPLKLNPVEISYLFNKKLKQRDFAALVVHMAQRGVIHFRRHEGAKMVYPGPKYEGKLRPYEKMILDTVEDFKPLKASDLINNYETIFAQDAEYDSLTKCVRADLEKKGYIRKNSFLQYCWVLLRGTTAILAVTVWLSLIIFWLYTVFSEGASDFGSIDDLLYSGAVFSAAMFIPVLLAYAIVKQLQAKSIGRGWAVRSAVRRYWIHIVGFRQFILLSEKEKLKFQSQALLKASSVNTLPYAMTFGVVDNWRDLVS